MPLENLVGSNIYITNLVPSNPVGTDPVSAGDDHIRGTKNALINSFPNINAPVTATPAELNKTATLDVVYAHINSPAFTGNPTAPTPAPDDADTSIATTAFVAAAFAAAFAAKSHTTNGYQKLPGGLILQWGTAAPLTGNSSRSETFPTAFTTCLNIQVQRNASINGTTAAAVSANIVSGTSFLLRNGSSDTLSPMWFAIGI